MTYSPQSNAEPSSTYLSLVAGSTNDQIRTMLDSPPLLRGARESYRYPSAYLSAPVDARLDPTQFTFARPLEAVPGPKLMSTAQLDHYHGELLNSSEDEDVALGICSVIWWGNYLVKGHPRASRAEVRVRWFLVGNPRSQASIARTGTGPVARIVREARRLLDEDRYGDALAAICQIPWLSIAFGTKVLAFLMPTKAGVYDVHISRAMGIANELRPTGHVSANGRRAFGAYCAQLIDVANRMNGSPDMMWTDTDGLRYPWRAVDVERAIFAFVTSMTRR